MVNLISSNDTEEGAATGSIDVEVLGGTAPYGFDWTGVGFMYFSSDEDLNELGAGVYALEVTDAQGCTATLDVEVGTMVGLSDFKASVGINVYPNPASEQVTVTWSRDMDVRTIALEDIAGRDVLHLDLQGAVTMNSWDVSNLPNGNYFVRFESSKQIFRERVVIAH